MKLMDLIGWPRKAAALGIIAVGLLSPANSPGQESDLSALLDSAEIVTENGRQIVKVDLRTTLQLALDRSLLLSSSRLEFNIARSELAAAEHRNNPTLTNSVSLGRNVTSSSFFTGTVFANIFSTESITYSSGLSKTTSSGITYGLEYTETRRRTQGITIVNEGDTPEPGSFSDWLDVSALEGTVSIPFFKDAGATINDIPVRLGELGVRDSRFTIRKDELSILATIAGTYWRLVGLQEGLEVRRQAVSLSEQLLQDNQARLRAGVLSPADVQVSESQLARDRVSTMEVERDMGIVEDQVRAVLNLKDFAYGFRASDAPMTRVSEFDEADLLPKVFANEPNLRLLQTQLQSSGYALAQARNEDDTDLDLDLSYILNGFSSSPVGGVSGFAQTDLHGLSATLTWSLPLYNYAATATINKRRLESQQLEFQIRNLESSLTVQLQSALRSLGFARAEVNSTRIAMELAKELLKNQVERFRLGRTTNFQVAEFQQDSREAAEREILARIRYESFLTDLLILTGEIYDYYQLQSRHPNGSDEPGPARN